MIPKECPLRRTDFNGWSTEEAISRIGKWRVLGLMLGNVHTDLPVNEQLALLEEIRERIAQVCNQCNQEGCDPYMFNHGGLVATVRVVNPDSDEERELLEVTMTSSTQRLTRIKK